MAVSGGPDSLALLLLAHAAIPRNFAVATVDHGMRAESGAEAAMVARICAERGIVHQTLPVTIAPGNIQDAARSARYNALAEWAVRNGIGAIATAHHADDQAETLVMRLNRASGLAGLAGVRARALVPGGSSLPLLRPLLGCRRSELGAVVAAAGLDPALDSSNHDPRFDRVRVRQQLAGCDWLDVPALAHSASHLADAAAALDWAVEREWTEAVTIGDDAIIYRPQAPRAIGLRVLARAIALLGGNPRGGEVARLLDRAGGSLGGVVARLDAGEWVLRREPRRRGA